MPGTERINIRATPELVELISRAAQRRKMSLTAFMLAASEALARKCLAETPAPPVHTSRPVQEVAEKVVPPEEHLTGMTWGQWLEQAEARQRQAADQVPG